MPLATHKGFQDLASQLFLLYKLCVRAFEVNLENHKRFQMAEIRGTFQKEEIVHIQVCRRKRQVGVSGCRAEKKKMKVFQERECWKRGYGHSESQDEKGVINLMCPQHFFLNTRPRCFHMSQRKMSFFFFSSVPLNILCGLHSPTPGGIIGRSDNLCR